MSDNELKYLDLTELARNIAINLDCSYAAAKQFVDVQDAYFEKIGVNVDPEEVEKDVYQPIVLDGDEMLKYIVDNAGLAEPFIRRMMDAEHEYMTKNGFVTKDGEVIPFIKTKGNK